MLILVRALHRVHLRRLDASGLDGNPRLQDLAVRLTHVWRQPRDLDEVRLLGVEDVPELEDVVEYVVNELFELLLLVRLLLYLLLLSRLFLECNDDESQEAKVHLRVVLEVGALVHDQLVQGH